MASQDAHVHEVAVLRRNGWIVVNAKGGSVQGRSLIVVLVFVACFLASVSSAGAITGGQYDGNNHPYVSFEDNGVFACSGTLLSPTVMLTAAHCFSDSRSVFGTNTVTGAPIVRVSFDPNLINTPRSERVWYFGTYYFDPQFRIGGRGGLPGFDTHDVAVIIFTPQGCSVPADQNGSCGSVKADATLGQYGALPSAGLVDTLGANTSVDIAGFGVQDFVRGGGPCGGSCKPRPGDVFSRFYAQTSLIASDNSISGSFIKLHANKGGVCFGDSGGPDLLAGTHTVLAVNAFGTNDLCTGVSYSYRVDTTNALTWITSTVSTHDASV